MASLSTSSVRVFLDDARPGRERVTSFTRPCDIVVAYAPEDIGQAFQKLERAVAGGAHAAGYLSYELGYALERRLAPLRPREGKLPLLCFGIFEQIEEYRDSAAGDFLRASSRGRAYAGPLTCEWREPEYRRRFDRVRELIAAGDIYQANLSFRARFAFAGDPLALYRTLRASSSAGHGAFVDDGERQLLSLSPELFFDIDGEGSIVTRPMKGTAARGESAADDEARRSALASSLKDRAENLMIVDLLRNDLSRVAQAGSVAVPSLFAIETYPTLHQMVSTVTARLKAGTGIEDIVRALFPCGSVTGAPKIRAMEVLRELEESPRGAYCGAIGHFAPDGSARFNVAIRTVTIAHGSGELGVGGAIVHDSDGAAEYREYLLKAQFFEAARRSIGLIETLAFHPGAGLARRDLHLARMARSAGALGLRFDAARANELLDGAVREKQLPTRVRLALDEAGTFSVAAAALEPTTRWTYAISPLRIASGDAIGRHKTSWRELYESEHARLSAALGCDEVLFLNERGELVEGSRTNIFLRREGTLVTPALACGGLDGCLRRSLIDSGECREMVVGLHDLMQADEVCLGNSLRGLIPAVPAALAEAAAS